MIVLVFTRFLTFEIKILILSNIKQKNFYTGR